MDSSSSSTSNHNPCAACKTLRRKCMPDCVFAPHFPPDDLDKFINVHSVYGARNIARILNELDPINHEEAVNSLAYEARVWLQNPVYGCLGLVSLLRSKRNHILSGLENAKMELAALVESNNIPSCAYDDQSIQQQKGSFPSKNILPGDHASEPPPQQMYLIEKYYNEPNQPLTEEEASFMASFNTLFHDTVLHDMDSAGPSCVKPAADSGPYKYTIDHLMTPKQGAPSPN